MFDTIKKYFINLKHMNIRTIIITILYVATMIVCMLYSPWSEETDYFYSNIRYIFFGIAEIMDIIAYTVRMHYTYDYFESLYLLIFMIVATFPLFRYISKYIIKIDNVIENFMAENISGYLITLLFYGIAKLYIYLSDTADPDKVAAFWPVLVIILIIIWILLITTYTLMTVEIFHVSFYIWLAVLQKFVMDHLPNIDIIQKSVYLLMFVVVILLIIFFESVIMEAIDEYLAENQGDSIILYILNSSIIPFKNLKLSIFIFFIIALESSLAMYAARYLNIFDIPKDIDFFFIFPKS